MDDEWKQDNKADQREDDITPSDDITQCKVSSSLPVTKIWATLKFKN